MKLSGRELTVLLVSAALAILSALLTQPLWQRLGIPSDLQNGTGLTVSIVILIIGHVLGAAVREEAHFQEINEGFNGFEKTLHASLSGVNGLRVFQTSDAALEYLRGRLPHARKVWNTRVPAPGYGDYVSAEARLYADTVLQTVKRGVHFREVVGLVFESRAKSLMGLKTSHKKAVNYDYVLWSDPSSPFFNFIVMEDDVGAREVAFGWIITPLRGFEQECFVSGNSHLIDSFVAMHDYMMSTGTRP
jgi:hypothetical protein